MERAPRIEALGAGITLFANAINALKRLGVAEAIAAVGAPAETSAILDARRVRRRLRNLAVRPTPKRVQRRQLEPIIHHEL